jgi:uncharacterized membrane protein
MPSLTQWLKLLHVVIAFWFVGGLLGRGVVIRQASRSSEVETVTELMRLAGRFETLMVIPGSVAVLVVGLLTAWAQHHPWFAHGSYWLVTSVGVYVASIALVPLVFVPRGRIFEAALEAARDAGRVTPELAAAFRDRAVGAARTAEGLVVAFVIAMMVLKPF